MRFRSLTIAVMLACASLGLGCWVLAVRHVSPVTKQEPGQRIKAPKLSTQLQEIIGLTAAKARSQQIGEHLHGLGKRMAWLDQEALGAWMQQPKPEYLPEPAWQWLANEAMDKLCQQEQPTPKLGNTLIAIYQSRSKDLVLRDYAIQHLAHYLQPASVWEPREQDPQRRKQFVAVLLQAAARTEESIAGTALQGMHLALLAREQIQAKTKGPVDLGPGVLKEEQLEGAALTLLQARQHHLLATITALQICAQRRCESVLPIARRIVDDPTNKIALRVTAISVLGQLGNSDDEQTLSRLALDQDARIAHAANLAMHRLHNEPTV